jgi:tRNA-dihydrouridine synthase B
MAGVTDRRSASCARSSARAGGVGDGHLELAALRQRQDAAAPTTTGEVEPISVQIAGADPAMMAEAARYNVDRGAQIIDINMGCPAKKVCNVMAGSALMQDEPLVARILEAVVSAVPEHTPVTLKFRTGWNARTATRRPSRASPRRSGIRAIAIHGRTRADQYTGEAEYDTIADVKTRSHSGDRQRRHHHAGEGQFVLDYTGADGVMIGRAAQGRPWLFREIEHFPGHRRAPAAAAGLPRSTHPAREHLADLYAFYGEDTGVQDRAQAHLLVHQGAGRLGGVPPRDEPVAGRRQATRCVDEFFGRLAEHSEHPNYAMKTTTSEELAA